MTDEWLEGLRNRLLQSIAASAPDGAGRAELEGLIDRSVRRIGNEPDSGTAREQLLLALDAELASATGLPPALREELRSRARDDQPQGQVPPAAAPGAAGAPPVEAAWGGDEEAGIEPFWEDDDDATRIEPFWGDDD